MITTLKFLIIVRLGSVVAQIFHFQSHNELTRYNILWNHSLKREFLKTIGGDCNTAVGCNAQIRRKKILLRTQLFADNGKKSFKAMLSGKILNPTELGKRVGKKILKKSLGYYKIKK